MTVRMSIPTPDTGLPKKSSRRTTKVMMGLNTVLAWCLAFYSSGNGDGTTAAAALAFNAATFGAYTGIGHLDLRAALRGDE